MMIIKKIAIKFLYIRQLLIWFNQYCECRKKSLQFNKLRPMLIENLGKVLIVAPHADDEWIGCYSIILKAKQVDVFYCRFYGDDYSESNIYIRDNEIKKSGETNGYNVIFADINNKKNTLLATIKKGYDSIFIPSPFDWHPEHRETYRITIETLLSIGNINKLFLYQISVPHRNYKNVYIASLNKSAQEEKWWKFEHNYRSQKMPTFRYRLQECLNAEGTQFYAGEIYTKPNKNEIKYDYMLSCQKKSYLDNYRNKINNIFSIREISLKAKIEWD